MSARYRPAESYADIGGFAACLVRETASGAPAYVALGVTVADAEERAEHVVALLNADAARPDFHWPDLAALDGDPVLVRFPVRS